MENHKIDRKYDNYDALKQGNNPARPFMPNHLHQKDILSYQNCMINKKR